MELRMAWMLVLTLVACGGEGDPVGLKDTGASGSDTSTPGDAGSSETGTASSVDALQALGQADAVLWGDASGDFAGSTVAFVGDVTGDGEGDLLVGVPADAKGGAAAGGVVLVPGPTLGEAALGDDGLQFSGSGLETAGLALARLGDGTSTGGAGFAVGAPYSGGAGVQRGAVYLFHEPVSSGGDLASADGIVWGATNYALAGWSLAGGKDITGDGVPDLLVGAKWQGTGSATYAGTVYVFSDLPSGEVSAMDADHALQGEASEDVVGQSVALIDDVDGDGLADVLMGAVWVSPDEEREHAGAAYLVSAAALASWDGGPQSLEAATAKLVGEQADDLAGWDVAGAGDVNGDGKGDLLVSAPAHTEVDGIDQVGVSYLLFGPVEGSQELADADVRILGDEYLEWSGAAVTAAGDQDGDGLDDVLVGSLYRSPGDAAIAGAALLFTDLTGGDVWLSEATVTFAGALEYDVAGWSLDGAADANGDGTPDLLVGASGADRGDEVDVGSVHLILGPVAVP